MNFAGKKFKDIYDSGAKALSDIESQASTAIKTAKDEHSKVHEQAAGQSLKQLEEKSSLLQGELKQSIGESLKKLENTLVLENTQSEAFVSSLVAELKMLTEQMKLKLKALKQSHQENVDFARTVASEEYLTDAEELSFELEQTLSSAIEDIGTQGKITLDGLQQSLEKLLLQAHSDVDEIEELNLISSKEQAHTIVDHSASLLATLSVDNQNRLRGLETSARSANQEVESSARSLLEDIANHATAIEKEINRNYDQITSAHYQNADNRLSNCADELSALHDATTEQLISLTDQLSADLLSRSTQVQDGLQHRCDDAVQQVDTSFDGFKNKLNERLQYSRGQKQALESDKNKILMAVQNELVSIQRSFAKKIATVLDQSKLELTDMTTAIEAQMVTAIDSFDQQMNNSAQSIQRQINDEVAKFLQELSSSRTDAVAEITGAAKGNMPISKLNQTRISNDSVQEDESKPDENNKVQKVQIDVQLEDDAQIQSEIQLEDDAQTQSNIPLQDETQSQVIVEGSSSSESKPRRNRRRKDNRE